VRPPDSANPRQLIVAAARRKCQFFVFLTSHPLLNQRIGCPLRLATRLHLTLVMFDPVTHHIEQYMDLLAARQKLVASNIANVDTPGYRTKDIDFHLEFLSHMDSSEKAQPTVFDVPGLLVHNDGNDVSLDREMKALSENAIRFSVASNLIKSEFRMVKSAIQEGK
jgi:flagellar basal-body rod protein FlgB